MMFTPGSGNRIIFATLWGEGATNRLYTVCTNCLEFVVLLLSLLYSHRITALYHEVPYR